MVRHPRFLAAVVTLVAIVAACGADRSSAPSSPSVSTAPPADSDPVPLTEEPAPSAVEEPGGRDEAAASCVEEYTAPNLSRRAFAFDGTVTAVRDEVDQRLPPGESVVPRAQFEVHRWFRPDGQGNTALVWMQRDVNVGDRLLVAGEPRWGGDPLDDAVAWECGFTTSYAESTAQEWLAAFSAGTLPASSDAATTTPTTAVPVPSTVASPWTVVPDGPLSPRSSAVSVWTGTEVIVVGGEPQAWCPPGGDCAVPDFAPLADGAAFDPADGTWRPIAPAPLTFSGNATAVSVDGSVYVLVRSFEVRPGGAGGFLRYDVAADTWRQLPSPGDDWYQITARGSTVVAYPSSGEAGERSDLVFDVTTETWQPLPPDPLSPSFGRAMVEVAGELYLFAHDLVPNPGSEEPSLLRAARFDATSGVWELRADSEILGGPPVAVGTAVVFPNSGSADGGQVNNWGRSYPYGGIYDTVNDEWSPLPEPASDDAFTIAGVLGDQIATYIGTRGELLDLNIGKWIAVPPLPDDSPDVINRSFVATGTSLFVLGGESWDDGRGELIDSSYIWTPAG